MLLAAALTRPGRRTDRAIVNAIENAAPRLALLALDAEHVAFTATGMMLDLRMTDAEPTRQATLTRGLRAEACPVRALEDWLRASDTAFGPVFRKVDRWGNVEHGRLHSDAWHRILARRQGPARRQKASRKQARP